MRACPREVAQFHEHVAQAPQRPGVLGDVTEPGRQTSCLDVEVARGHVVTLLERQQTSCIESLTPRDSRCFSTGHRQQFAYPASLLCQVVTHVPETTHPARERQGGLHV